MTLEFILECAKNSMIKGHHNPSCFSSFHKGFGYIGTKESNPDHLRQLERTVQSEIDNIGFASEYAEPGYSNPEKGILFANWNSFPRNFDRILENYGYSIEWSDEWATCMECYRAIRTSPDSWGYTPFYEIKNECEIFCLDCVGKLFTKEEKD